uniref:Bifunctional glutamine synthetase adenylyltransferase/adenylyl-removing enzyme n=1 Tax=Candidatus Kentrum sp. SD TaxID=2126332 RepID=A0A450YWC4_9GAMM|nr:MAG: glutamate-ammonia-ligase adenylyltransferase [Candidatus Kentron sp. SD]VFK45805.1 MAG: glutamate-ammonia-ligase adenylyltransferase [Candidatus Kentron sp. SD]VFK79783.1 MAG: glutamate-ammonia-ligase adenylyltransferase [Candidatus Kentron sp. SD]
MFQDLARRRLREFQERAKAPEVVENLLDLPIDTLRAWACSDFITDTCIRNPMLVQDLLATGDLSRAYPSDYYAREAKRIVSAASSEEDLLAVLRRFRQREMVRIAWRDLGGGAGLDETVGDLSVFADAIIDATLTKLHGWLREKLGTPLSEAGEPQRLVVLAMGKLGARELNFSSDVDLIFAFPKSGQTVATSATGRQGGLSNDEFFIRLGRKLIRLLSENTVDGMVFRVDMRLRPFGGSGPLAVSFNALEDYYQTHGRDWERYALIRARSIAGDITAGNDLLIRLRPFVYRRYLDFGAIESLREMKALIAREIQQKGYRENIKLGPGGIREVEFLGQVFQIIHGGREPDLRERRILTVIGRLGERNHLPESTVRELSDAYRFLRIIEHRLQEVDDRQTHHIPEDEWARNRIAAGAGFTRWADLSRLLQQHRNNIQRHFNGVFAEPDVAGMDSGQNTENNLTMLISKDMDQTRGGEILRQAGFSDDIRIWKMLDTLRNDTKLRFLSERGQQRLEKLLPLVLQSIMDQEASPTTVERVFQVLEAIGRRSVYFSLLRENPIALEHLVRLCAASPWITRRIAQHPLLLGALLRPHLLYTPLKTSELERDLANRLRQVPPGDGEQEMEALRRFKQANVLRVASADVCDAMPLMVVSDYLTDIAGVCLRWILRLAWRDSIKRYGKPRCTWENGARNADFLIVGYGKLGGFELGYGSDLDLVFLHDSCGAREYTNGKKSIENSVFFGRLGQRIVNFLSAHTPMGILYEVDTRLRPSGQSGFLVSNIDAFADYQDREAWIWEHQALVRARVVAGSANLAKRFEAIRAEILRAERDPEKLRREVRQMRERMRGELDHPPAGLFNLKQGRGGITDIEFIVQYVVLGWADRLEGYLAHRDNIHLLKGIANTGLVDEEESELLADAYCRYRSKVHALALQERPPLVEKTAFIEERALVTGIWKRLMEES